MLLFFGGLSECIKKSKSLSVLNNDKTVSGQDQYTRTIYNFFESIGTNLSKIPNIHFTEEDANTLILDSDVVCNFGSNTIVEAGFATKPVIIPVIVVKARYLSKPRILFLYGKELLCLNI